MESDSVCLFSDKELYLMSHNQQGRSFFIEQLPSKTKRKRIYENMHLMDGMSFTSTNSFPQIKAYTGSTDFSVVPFTDWKRSDGIGQAAHFFLDDYRFRDKVWCNLERTTQQLSKFDYVFTPDFSLWKDLPTEFPNKENIYRTRFVGCLWQMYGFNVIPTASWGGLNSFSYCFEGLPCNSIIAVSGMGNRKSTEAFRHWCYGLHRLEDALSPILILVYGEQVEVEGLHTELEFIPCFIEKRLRKI
ncbi:MAG: DUF4417 domain-containing protein [Candidatus Cryptobacteroides sp.]